MTINGPLILHKFLSCALMHNLYLQKKKCPGNLTDSGTLLFCVYYSNLYALKFML